MLSSATLFITHLKPPFLLYINLYLEKIYFKKQTDHSLEAYKKQRKNYCSRLYKKVRRETFPQNDKEIADEVNSFFKSSIPNLEKKYCNMFYHKSDFPKLKQRSSKVAWLHMPVLQLD